MTRGSGDHAGAGSSLALPLRRMRDKVCAGDEPLLTAPYTSHCERSTTSQLSREMPRNEYSLRSWTYYVYYTRESGTTDRQIGSAQPECYYNMCTASERAAACERARPDEWRASGPARGRVAAGRRRRVRRARVWLGGSVDLRTQVKSSEVKSSRAESS